MDDYGFIEFCPESLPCIRHSIRLWVATENIPNRKYQYHFAQHGNRIQDLILSSRAGDYYNNGAVQNAEIWFYNSCSINVLEKIQFGIQVMQTGRILMYFFFRNHCYSVDFVQPNSVWRKCTVNWVKSTRCTKRLHQYRQGVKNCAEPEYWFFGR